MNYYSHHIGDYTADAAHLTMLEDGAYRRLLDRYYTTEAPLQSDWRVVCRLVRAHTTEECDAVVAVLSEFFDLADDGWHHKRCDAEILAYQAKAEANRVNGGKGGRPKKTEQEPTNNPQKTQVVSENNPQKTQTEPTENPQITLTNNQEPITNNQEPYKSKTKAAPAAPLPDWVPVDAWSGFVAMRKAIKKPLTADAVPIAIKKLQSLRDAGHDPQSVLEQSTMNSWQGLFEIKPGQQARASPAGPSQLGRAGQGTAANAQRLMEKWRQENEQAG